MEDWKKALVGNKFVAAILMDLSKAFDRLPIFNLNTLFSLMKVTK
jgi:hypothetical protein